VKSSELYRAFHDSTPKARKVSYEPPVAPLIAIGELLEISYIPYGSSRRKGTAYSHKSGDLGHKVLRTNLLLVTDSRGKNLYLIKKNPGSKWPRFSSQGILG